VSIRTISEKIGCYLSEKIEDPEKAPTLTYGLELIFSEIIKLTILLLVSYFFGLFTFTVIILSTSIPLRIITGGQHCSSSLRCQFGLLLTFPVLAYVAKIISYYINPVNLLLLALTSSVLMVLTLEKYGPGYSVNHPNPSQTLINKTKRYTYVFLISWLASVLSLVYFLNVFLTQSVIISSMSLGVLWQTFLLTPLGHQLILKVDKCLISLKIN